MATALKFTAPNRAKKPSKIETQIAEAIEAVTPLYEKFSPGDYWDRIGRAVSDKLGPLTLAHAIKLQHAAHALEETFECDGPEHHGMIALGDYCIHQICVRPATNVRDATARLFFIFARLDEDETPDKVFMASTYLPELKLAGRRIAEDMRALSKRTLPERIGADAASVDQVYLANDDPEFNPLRDIAGRMKVLDQNWDELCGAEGCVEDDLFAELDTIGLQACRFQPHTPNDILTVLAGMYVCVSALRAELSCKVECADPEQIAEIYDGMAKSVDGIHCAIYRLTEWIECAHATERRSVVGNRPAYEFNPYRPLQPLKLTVA